MESNEVEIYRYLGTKQLIALSCIIVVVLAVPLGLFSMAPGGFFFLVLIVLLIIVAFIGLLGYYTYTRNKWIRFVISNERFMLIKPKKVKFEIHWSEFEVMKLKVLGEEIGSLKPRKMQRRTNMFKIKLLRKSDQRVIKDVKFAWPNRREARQIMDLIIEYATNMGRDVILKKRDM
ncbi:MAG: hypothetical protein ACFE9T_11500 [Promethearchaeota archaeon]